MKLSALTTLLMLSTYAIAEDWRGKECPQTEDNFYACANGAGDNCSQYYGCWIKRDGVGKMIMTAPHEIERYTKEGLNAVLFRSAAVGRGGGSPGGGGGFAVGARPVSEDEE